MAGHYVDRRVAVLVAGGRWPRKRENTRKLKKIQNFFDFGYRPMFDMISSSLSDSNTAESPQRLRNAIGNGSNSMVNSSPLIEVTVNSTAVKEVRTTTILHGEQQHENSSRTAMARYNGPSIEEMTSEQLEIYHSILQTRPTTGISGPFGPWLAVPQIAQPAQQLGRACRYRTSLSSRESELIILLTAVKYQSPTEWDIHVPEALTAGLTIEQIHSISRCTTNIPMKMRCSGTTGQQRQEGDDGDFHQTLISLFAGNIREQSIIKFAIEVLITNTVSDLTYQQTKVACGGQDSVLVEITSIIGYYALVAYTLNVFQIPCNPNNNTSD